MTSPTEITIKQLSRQIGLANSPAIIDVRLDEDFAINPTLIPGSRRRSHQNIDQWAADYVGQKVIIVCHKGQKLSQGVAALLRADGIDAETLEGGFVNWVNADQLKVNPAKLPPRDSKERTLWVTRARPKIDRIACPWLIKRFIDPDAAFLFVSPAEVKRVAERFNGVAFDIEGSFWSHRGNQCTFDTMLSEFGLVSSPLQHLATIVRGADTGHLNLAPEAAGLLAISLGFSRMYRDDLDQLAASMAIYDGLYRWCRDATDETHNGSPSQSGTGK